MVKFSTSLPRLSRAVLLLVALLCTVVGLSHYKLTSAALVDPRSLQLSNSNAGETNVTYKVSIGITSPGTLGSIRLQFCSNTSLLDDTCDAPAGFDALNAALAEQTGETGFSIHPTSTANELIFSRVPTSASATLTTFTVDTITNPADMGSYFARVLTYQTSDATGSHTDAGGLAFATNSGLSLSVEVPPFLLFCAGVSISGYNCATTEGDFVDFGSLGSDRTGAGVSQMLAATNAAGGYSIRVAGTPLASGTNVIDPMANQPSQTGLSQFGMNLRENLMPNVGREVEGPGIAQVAADYGIINRYQFGNGEVVAASTAVDDYRKYTVSYIVNVPKGQPGGVYAATMTYICLANF